LALATLPQDKKEPEYPFNKWLGGPYSWVGHIAGLHDLERRKNLFTIQQLKFTTGTHTHDMTINCKFCMHLNLVCYIKTKMVWICCPVRIEVMSILGVI
jgi:hypothetical protein